MIRYSGFIKNGYRFETLVPSIIFDERECIINAYRLKDNKKVDMVNFRLTHMPKWHTPLQAVVLSKKDENALEHKTNELIRKLQAKSTPG